jgi:hypothetical protein
MGHDLELDRILASLARAEIAGMADKLLDLREWALTPANPGSCVKAYFELVAEAPCNGVLAQPLAELRMWLEGHLSIEVLDASRLTHLESLPLALAGETDLENFCHTAMQRMRDDRCHTAPRLRLEFSFARTHEDANAV